MKTDRLLAILHVLALQGKMTAPMLAEKFEVHPRTIRRDLETLCLAGFPIVTEQGRGGGISLAPGFRLDAQALEKDGLRLLLSGVYIDLASHYKASLTEKIGLLRQAVRGGRLVFFRYFSPRGQTQRTVEPCRVLFQWGEWYLLAWDRDRQDFRRFKLSRLWELVETDIRFAPREVPAEQVEDTGLWQEQYRLTALFDPAVSYRLVEEYGPDCFTVEPDGRLLFSRGFTFWENLHAWVSSFGSRVEVLEPEELRDELLE